MTDISSINSSIESLTTTLNGTYLKEESPREDKKTTINGKDGSRDALDISQPSSPESTSSSPIKKGDLDISLPSSTESTSSSPIKKGDLDISQPSSTESRLSSPVERGDLDIIQPSSAEYTSSSSIEKETNTIFKAAPSSPLKTPLKRTRIRQAMLVDPSPLRRSARIARKRGEVLFLTNNTTESDCTKRK